MNSTSGRQTSEIKLKRKKTEVIQETQPLDEQFSCFFLSCADADNIKLSVITFILQVREKKKIE